MSVATPADVISINARLGDKVDTDIQKWLDSFEGELLFAWKVTLPTIILPLDTDPLTTTVDKGLLELIRLAEMFAGAALMEGAPEIGQSPDQMAASFNFYITEYEKRKTRIEALTDAQLIKLGVPYDTTAVTITSTVANGGLTRAGNNKYGTRSRSIAWYDAHPFNRQG